MDTRSDNEESSLKTYIGYDERNNKYSKICEIKGSIAPSSFDFYDHRVFSLYTPGIIKQEITSDIQSIELFIPKNLYHFLYRGYLATRSIDEFKKENEIYRKIREIRQIADDSDKEKKLIQLFHSFNPTMQADIIRYLHMVYYSFSYQASVDVFIIEWIKCLPVETIKYIFSISFTGENIYQQYKAGLRSAIFQNLIIPFYQLDTDIKIDPKISDILNEWNFTYLDWAIFLHQNDEIQDICSKNPASVNIKSGLKKSTPTHKAVHCNNKRGLDILLEQKNIDLNITDDENRLAISYVVMKKNIAVATIYYLSDVLSNPCLSVLLKYYLANASAKIYLPDINGHSFINYLIHSILDDQSLDNTWISYFSTILKIADENTTFILNEAALDNTYTVFDMCINRMISCKGNSNSLLLIKHILPFLDAEHCFKLLPHRKFFADPEKKHSNKPGMLNEFISNNKRLGHIMAYVWSGIADVNAIDETGKSVLQCAIAKKNVDVIAFLLSEPNFKMEISSFNKEEITFLAHYLLSNHYWHYASLILKEITESHISIFIEIVPYVLSQLEIMHINKKNSLIQPSQDVAWRNFLNHCSSCEMATSLSKMMHPMCNQAFLYMQMIMIKSHCYLWDISLENTKTVLLIYQRIEEIYQNPSLEKNMPNILEDISQLLRDQVNEDQGLLNRFSIFETPECAQLKILHMNLKTSIMQYLENNQKKNVELAEVNGSFDGSSSLYRKIM